MTNKLEVDFELK